MKSQAHGTITFRRVPKRPVFFPYVLLVPSWSHPGRPLYPAPVLNSPNSIGRMIELVTVCPFMISRLSVRCPACHRGSLAQQSMCILDFWHMYVSDFVIVQVLSVLECVLTHPGKIVRIWPAQLIWLQQQESPRNSVQEPGPNVQRWFPSI